MSKKIKLVKSLIGRKDSHIATANSLGLRKIGDTTVQPDNAATQGKIASIGCGNQRQDQDHKLFA